MYVWLSLQLFGTETTMFVSKRCGESIKSPHRVGLGVGCSGFFFQSVSGAEKAVTTTTTKTSRFSLYTRTLPCLARCLPSLLDSGDFDFAVYFIPRFGQSRQVSHLCIKVASFMKWLLPHLSSRAVWTVRIYSQLLFRTRKISPLFFNIVPVLCNAFVSHVNQMPVHCALHLRIGRENCTAKMFYGDPNESHLTFANTLIAVRGR